MNMIDSIYKMLYIYYKAFDAKRHVLYKIMDNAKTFHIF